MTEHSTIWACVAGLGAGMAAGAAHFVALSWNARYFAAGRIGVALGAQAVRCVLTALFLFALARVGIPALLAGMGGLLLARHAVLRIAVQTR